MRCCESIDSQIGVFVILHPEEKIIQRLVLEVYLHGPEPGCSWALAKALGVGEGFSSTPNPPK